MRLNPLKWLSKGPVRVSDAPRNINQTLEQIASSGSRHVTIMINRYGPDEQTGFKGVYQTSIPVPNRDPFLVDQKPLATDTPDDPGYVWMVQKAQGIVDKIVAPAGFTAEIQDNVLPYYRGQQPLG